MIIKHSLDTSIAHAHEVQHDLKKNVSYTITGVEVAEQSVVDTLEMLETSLKNSGILDDILEVAKKTGRNMSTLQPTFSGNEEESIEELIEDYLKKYRLEYIFKKNVKLSEAFSYEEVDEYLQILHDPVDNELMRYVRNLSNNKSELVEIIKQDKKRKYDWRSQFGKCISDVSEIRKREKIDNNFKQIREFVAKNCLPPGIGFTSKYEYQWFLAKYIFLETDEIDQNE
ncbi:MAG TPA: hypothetical protein ENJ28_09215, partial [Gammaproteobacteria bacterium]|nr:hypothetical protein [Gammaproteobacteria bacterium]